MNAASIVEASAVEEIDVSAVSWPAILAGGAAAAAISMILLALGAGVGFSTVSPWSSAGAMTAFRVSTGLYFIVTAMIASSIGGYLAGRLRTRWRGAHTREVFFRDTAHGLLAWAFATLLSAGVLGSAANTIAGGAAAAIPRIAGQQLDILGGTVETLLRADPAAMRDANASTATAARTEVRQVFATSFQSGSDMNVADRAYLARIVAERAGISEAAAEQRVATAIDQARTAVDNARKAAAHFALWLTASLLIGAFSASLAAIEGGGLRDGTWGYRV
jgi:hypothetical protein